MSIWVGGEGWAAFGNDDAKVEAAEKVAKKEKEERELLAGKGKTGEANFLPTLDSNFFPLRP
jgi:hypothetical protein